MASTFTHSFLNTGIVPLFAGEAKATSVALAASQTLAKGTVLGEIDKTDTYSLETGSQGSGTFTLTFGGVTTTALARNISAANIQAALVLLSSIGTGNVTVVLASGTPGTDAVYTITFAGTLANVTNGALTADFALMATPGNASLTQTIVGEILGTYKAYNNSNTDGSQVAKAILQFDCAVDASKNITLGGQTGGGPFGQTQKTAPAFFRGTFMTSDLTGLDANAVTDLGRLIEGTLANGQLRLP